MSQSEKPTINSVDRSVRPVVQEKFEHCIRDKVGKRGRAKSTLSGGQLQMALQ
jgi:hypothetical protein